MNYTEEQIMASYDALSSEVREILDKPETTEKILSIAERYGLLLDKANDLNDEIVLILLGLTKSSEFVERVSKKLNISQKTATALAQDVNREIFDSIRKYIKERVETIAKEPEQEVLYTQTQRFKQSEGDQDHITPIERAGGFSIEKDAAGDGGGQIGQDRWKEVTHADRERMLEHIEDRQPQSENMTRPGTEHTEPLVDFLLENPVAQREHVVPATEHAPQPPANLPITEEVGPAETIAPNIPLPAPSATSEHLLTIQPKPAVVSRPDTAPQPSSQTQSPPISPKPAPSPRTSPDPYRESIE